MVQAAVCREESEIWVAGDEVADLGAEAEQRQAGLEVEPAAELQRGFILRQVGVF